MVIYCFELLLILILGLLHKAGKVSRKAFIVLSFFVMALVLALRGNAVGEDTRHFLQVFDYAQRVTWKTALTSGFDTIYTTVYHAELSIETGYLIFNKIIGLFTLNGQWLLVIVAFTTCSLFGKFVYDNFQKPFFPTYIFLCESLYMNAFNLMRQMLALAIGIQAYTLIKDRKYKKAVAIIFLAFLFHKTALLLLVLFPLCKTKRKKRAIKYAVLSAAAVNLILPIIANFVGILIPRYANYFTTNYWGANIGGGVLLWLIEICICAIFYFKRINNDDNNLFVPVASTILYLGFEMLGLRLTMFTRIAIVFRPFLLFLFQNAEMLFSRKSRRIYQIAMMLILAFLFVRYASSDARIYQFFWQ